MICPHCAANNKAGNTFCTECGWKLIRPVEPAMEKTPEAPKLTFESPWGKEKEEKKAEDAQTNETTNTGYQGSYQSTVIHNGDEPVRKVGFGEAVTSFFRNYVEFKGRATRSEYWYVALFCFLVDVVIGLVGRITGLTVENTLQTIWSLAVLLPSLGLCWRRMHDIGKSGLLNLLLLLPLVGWIICIVFYCQPSVGDNEYGPRKTEWNR